MGNIGPVMLDIESTQLQSEDLELIANEKVGGLIIFSRNFKSAEQIFDLTKSIRQINGSIIIAVDQEGGRVQRLTDGFSVLPSLNRLGELYRKKPDIALEFASKVGELMALEVQSVGCDISFAPVLDLGFETSKVIGKRAFSTEVKAIVELGENYIQGMKNGGMLATGKHFPGHGSVEADSHFEIPVDKRSFDEISKLDLVPFAKLAEKLGGIMPAHIIFEAVDENPAGFSELWLKDVLRKQLQYDGVIFSDDLSMKGAEAAGDYNQRAKAALQAGCDMVLVCNDRPAAKQVVEGIQSLPNSPESSGRLARLKMRQNPMGLDNLKQTERWQELKDVLAAFDKETA
ncbi:MAG: beta-N-acetylhexosaminidase [Kangiellaceae bacterium]|nr:beta-N-acetylhexosaminidase [Kangiellaceae bacterium]